MRKIDEFNERLKKSKIAIIGLGVSNIDLLDYLYKLSCDVTIFSDNKITCDISKYGYQVYEGENCLSNLLGFDIIFRSPGCLPNRQEIVDEINRGCHVTTEVMEVIKNCPCQVIGITGSDGKTTTSTLVDLVLRSNGYHTYLGGNIGIPLFTKIGEMKENDKVILELSSFQLMDMSVSPDISIITNISENHLDKHSNYQEYIDSKCNIYKHSDGILVLNYDNEITNKLTSNREIRYFSRYTHTNGFYIENDFICFKGQQVINVHEFNIRGMHNYENICACLTALYDMVSLDISLKAIKEFDGVEHRLEFVREINGVKWYNDSVSSSPTRTMAGIDSYQEDMVLILGGYDKNLDYTILGEKIVDRVKKVILFGNTKKKIYDAIMKAKGNKKIDVYVYDTLQQVVDKAYEIAIDGEIVLFSPASASFDLFKNFADRGIQFKELVNKLK